ncbi:hypothetical protein [Mesorhizobium sp.]|uniref:hypothetical protein n=1 Tax=Mesorhizobium sp. TaxID=1871066 RepID=UPI000FE9B88A|nr:hypothetical protein [Mesorhizobium sp.]RWA93343.1 MAG: hypothetical protein EOQ32_13790 [Mesorhizobium sp.]
MTNHTSEAQPSSARVSLSALIQDEGTQIREGIDWKLVEEYRRHMQAGAIFPPITVAPVDDADHRRGFVLVDGWHRTKAAEAAGNAFIDATVVTGANPDEYRWIAAQNNMRHGKRLKPSERREVFRAYVKAGRHKKPGKKSYAVRVKSAREMERELGGIISARTVPVWMRRDFPAVWKLMKEAGDVVETGSEFGKPDPDDYYASNTKEALQQVLANFRAVKAPDVQKGLLQAIAKAAAEAAQMATGTHELPTVLPDEF